MTSPYFYRFLIPLVLTCSVSFLRAQVVTVADGDPNCFGSGVNFFFVDTDNAGYNRYQAGADGSRLFIYFRDGRWRLGDPDGQADNFDTFNFSDFASTPNPPSSPTGNWVTTQAGADDGCPNDITVSGSGTQDFLGGDPCADAGGDSDGDGICDNNDICPGGDDNANRDGDDVPDACDDFPDRFDGIRIDDDKCFTRIEEAELLFVDDGTDADGRRRFRNVNENRRNLEIVYEAAAGRWVMRSSNVSENVAYINTLASLPNPPSSAARAWQVHPDLSCSTAPVFFGTEVQDDLGCPVAIQSVATTDAENGNDGTINVAADASRPSYVYTIDGPVRQSNSTGRFSNLPGGEYTVSVADDRFPSGVCQEEQNVLVFDPALPLTLLDFTATAAEDHTLLRWTTVDEVGVQYHDVERSTDDRQDWKRVARIEAAGTTREQRDYTATDPSPVDRAYYRLRSRDYDGSEQFGPVVHLRRTPKRSIRLHPNPVDDLLTVTLTAATAERPLMLHDGQGRHLRTLKVAGGQTTVDLATADLSPGVYVISNGEWAKRFVKR